MIDSVAWVLPRPSKSKYPGSFPLYFEQKLLRELGLTKDADILQPFGGMAEIGTRMDIQESITLSDGRIIPLHPDVLGDAHHLPFADDSFDLVLLDPPYDDEQSKKLYNTGRVKLKFKDYTAEAVRVTRLGGHIAVYHWLATPALLGCVLVKRIFIETRTWHRLRCVHIHQKDPVAAARKLGVATYG